MPANSTEDLSAIGEHAYAREYFRNLVFQEILIAFKASGMTRASLARRLGRKPEQITRWFSAPGNLEIDTISDLLMAMGTRPESILRAREHAVPSANVTGLMAKIANPEAPNTHHAVPGSRIIKTPRPRATANRRRA